jgi:hypothetical protein
VCCGRMNGRLLLMVELDGSEEEEGGSEEYGNGAPEFAE